MYEPWGECDPVNEELEFHSVYTLAGCMQECFDRYLISEFFMFHTPTDPL